MSYDMDLINGKLTRWNHYINSFSLPTWEHIPDLGLYMDQVVEYILRALDFFPVGMGAEPIITNSAINNYVRLKVMPAPVKKKYGRTHLAYLIMICTLKQSLSISYIQQLLPTDPEGDTLEKLYRRYTDLHALASRHFVNQVALSTGVPSLGTAVGAHKTVSSFIPLPPLAANSANEADDAVWELIICSAIISSFSGLLAEKLVGLQGQSFTNEAVSERPIPAD